MSKTVKYYNPHLEIPMQGEVNTVAVKMQDLDCPVAVHLVGSLSHCQYFQSVQLP